MKIKKLFSFISLLIVFTFYMKTACSQNMKLPQPFVVTPALNGKAPSDAIVLFDKGSLDNFESSKDGGPAMWKVKGSEFIIVPGTGDIRTKQKFGNCQVHIEWKTPVKDVKDKKEGQGCGNSGIYFMKRYEVQVLNSYLNKTYPDGQAGAIYARYPPMVNASAQPGKWQSYDIVFTAPVFYKNGNIKSNGYFTVFHNGVLVQNHVEINTNINEGDIEATGELYKSPIFLQDHGNEISYRNFWVREF